MADNGSNRAKTVHQLLWLALSRVAVSCAEILLIVYFFLKCACLSIILTH